MSRAIYFVLPATLILVGAGLSLVGDRIGLPATDISFWSLLGAAIVVVALPRLIASFGTSRRSSIAGDAKPPEGPPVLIMKAPRFAPDRHSG